MFGGNNISRLIKQAENGARTPIPDVGMVSTQKTQTLARNLGAGLMGGTGEAHPLSTQGFQVLGYLDALHAFDRQNHCETVFGLVPLAVGRFVRCGYGSGAGQPDQLLSNALFLLGREYLRYAQWLLASEFFYYSAITTDAPDAVLRDAMLALICAHGSNNREAYTSIRRQVVDVGGASDGLTRTISVLDSIQSGAELKADHTWLAPLWTCGQLPASLVIEQVATALNSTSRHREAQIHCEVALKAIGAAGSEEWLEALLRQQRARALVGQGLLDEAMDDALAGWHLSENLRFGTCEHALRETVWARYMESRKIAFDCAVRRERPELVAAFITKDHLRASLSATLELADLEKPSTVDVSTGVQASIDSSLPPGITAPRALFTALEDAINATELMPPQTTATPARTSAKVPWWLGISRYGSSLYWTVLRDGEPVECGEIDLLNHSDLNDMLLGFERETGGIAFGADCSLAEYQPTFDPIYHLAEWGSAEEQIAMSSLGALIPPSLVAAMHEASLDQPVELVIASGSRLSGVPWPIAQIGTPHREGFRLVERASIRHWTSHKLDERRAIVQPSTPLELLVVIDDPRGSLVGASTFLASNARQYFGSTSALAQDAKVAFRDALQRECGGHQAGIFYYRGHAHSWNDPASTSLDLPDSLDHDDDSLVVRAGEFFGRFPNGAPYLPLPTRVVLSCCSSSGRSLLGGEAIGLAAACILGGGASEVIATGYDIPDCSFATAFDDLLGAAMTNPIPHDLALRQLQLRMYDEWRIYSVRGGVTPGDDIVHPHPMIWAMYQAI